MNSQNGTQSKNQIQSLAEKKYRHYQPVGLTDRTWPDQIINKAPIWCSVDLRDGNQALVTPMSLDQKLEMFQLLVDIGFKQIEVGFPSAAEVEFKFLRTLVERNLIPADVTVQVLTQAREHLIRRTFEALEGVPQAILHLYNSTSELQRRVVFRMDRPEIKKLATDGAKLVKSLTAETSTNIILEYSPESFTGTEIDFAVEVCEGVMEVWQPTANNKIILNLPATVEMSTPNIYADQIEYFCRNLNGRENAIVSIHPHNDRGTGVAAAEFALMAGGDRIEGTLFGNGERTGNVDIVTLALNMFSQGVNPELDFSNINSIRSVCERNTDIKVHPRHPYAGELVYTAFSGSHQDAINKGLAYRREHDQELWQVPYLPIDPTDVGRTYESIIRINSQSGKGGVAYILETEFGYSLPRSMHPEMGTLVQHEADKSGREITPTEILEIFKREYLNHDQPFVFESFRTYPDPDDSHSDSIKGDLAFSHEGQQYKVTGTGNGPIDAAKNALREVGFFDYSIENYHEHSLDQGSESRAIAYIQLRSSSGASYFGAGIDVNIYKASVKAIFSALNRAAKGAGVMMV